MQRSCFFSQGYLRLLSPQLLNTVDIVGQQSEARLFDTTGTPWTNLISSRRYYLSFPFYPFRTLCPREMATFQSNKHLADKMDYDNASCLLPAHTQMSVTLKRRNIENYLDFMLPFNLTGLAGSLASTLTEAQRNTAVTFQKTVANAQVNTKITAVNIVINAAYLQVF